MESITSGLPTSKAGILAGREPLARMQWSNVTVWLAPPGSLAAISSVFEFVNRALPRTIFTLRRRESVARPPVRAAITFSLRARRASRSILGFWK